MSDPALNLDTIPPFATPGQEPDLHPTAHAPHPRDLRGSWVFNHAIPIVAIASSMVLTIYTLRGDIHDARDEALAEAEKIKAAQAQTIQHQSDIIAALQGRLTVEGLSPETQSIATRPVEPTLGQQPALRP